MTHTRPLRDSDGKFDIWKLSDLSCPKCGAKSVRVRVWESSDGAYEDYQYKCFGLTCSHTWWIDGIDS